MNAPKGHELKYAIIERERRFLCRTMPPGDVVKVARIRDRYIDGTRLRLREMKQSDGVFYKLTQKIPEDQRLTTIYLSRAEYDVFAQLPAHTLAKTRHSIPPFGVDVFEGELAGLLIAEAELDDDDAMARLPRPPWGVEVTNDVRFTGGHFVTLDRDRLRELLATVTR